MFPVLFTLFGQRVYAYGVMLGLSLLLGFRLTVRAAERPGGVGKEVAGNAYLLAVIAGLVGARLTYVALNPVLIVESGAAWWDFQSGGLIGVGGLLLAMFAAFAYLRAKGLSFQVFADAAAPALAVFVVLGRIGSYLYGSDFGERLGDGAPGFLKSLGTFPRWPQEDLWGPPVLAYHVERYFLPRDATLSLPTHPVQLYEALFGVALLVGALRLQRKGGPVGAVFLPVLMALAVGRFLLDYLRADPDRGELFGFTITQLVCIFAVPACFIAYQQAKRRGS